MKKLFSIAIASLSFGVNNAFAAGWTNNLTIDRVAPRPDANKFFVAVTGANYVHTCAGNNGVNYIEIPTTHDPNNLLYSTLLTLFATKTQAIFYVDSGCSSTIIESCGIDTGSCASF